MTDDAADILSNEPIARKSLTMFYLIDTSGSMDGEKIGQVNTVMEEVIPEIRDIGGSDSEIRMAVMTFDQDITWMYDEPKSVEEIVWSRLETGTITNMGMAFEELNSKLSRNGYMKSASLSFAPVIFLLSDGWPSDDYNRALVKLRGNKWFKYAIKIAIAIGQDADRNVLAEFTGNTESVVEVNNGASLRKMIKFLTVTSSQIGSKSSSLDSNGLISPGAADDAKQTEMIGVIQAVDPDNVNIEDGW